MNDHPRNLRRHGGLIIPIAGALALFGATAFVRSFHVSLAPTAFTSPAWTFETTKVDLGPDLPPSSAGIELVGSPEGERLALYVGGERELLESSDGGRTFTRQQFSSVGTYLTMLLHPDGLVMAGADLSSLHPLKHSRVNVVEPGASEARVVLEGERVDASVPEQLRNLALAQGPDGSLHLAVMRSLRGHQALGYLSAPAGGAWQSRGFVTGARLPQVAAWPAIAAGAGVVYVGYADDVTNRIRILKSEDEGASWQECAATPLGGAGSMEPFIQKAPALFVSEDGRLSLFYLDTWKRAEGLKVEVRTDVVFATSEDQCERWSGARALNDAELRRTRMLSSDTNLSEDPEASALTAHVSPDGRYAVALWRDRRSGPSQVQYAVSRDGGKSWSANQELSAEDGRRLPAFKGLVGNDGRLHVFFKNQQGALFHGAGAL